MSTEKTPQATGTLNLLDNPGEFVIPAECGPKQLYRNITYDLRNIPQHIAATLADDENCKFISRKQAKPAPAGGK